MRKTPTLLLLTALCLATLPTVTASNNALPAASSLVVTNATVIDGTGRQRFRANIRIEDDRIKTVGLFQPEPGERVIQADGMVVAPGFIDIHNHSEEGLSREPAASNQVSQGITTLAVGPDGSSPWPIKDYLEQREKQGTAVNVLCFVGHGTLREQVMGKDYDRPSTPEETAKMKTLVEQAMAEGAFGLSSGLEYDAGRAATTGELIELARAAAHNHGLYMTHMRDEEEGMLAALREAILIGAKARLPVQISHIKMGNRNVWRQAPRAIALINRARRNGADVTADCYPYTAWASTIAILVPSRRHEDRREVETGLRNVGGAQNVLITNCRAHPDFEGKTLDQIASAVSSSPIEVYQRIVRDGGASVVCSSMNESDVHAFYRQPWVMVASDGGIGSRHPRGAGTFTRVLGQFVREKHLLTLEEAVRKMSSAPARRLSLTDRGVIREGMKADLVIFDPSVVRDRSTFKEPGVLSIGIYRVLVNGQPVWENGSSTGRLPGVAIRNNSKDNQAGR